MVDVTDVQGYETKFENQKALLERSDDLADADRDAIERWVVHLRTNDPEVDSLGTVVGHLNRIRLAAERSEMPLTDMERIGDVNALKLYLEDEHGLGEGTIRNYMKAARKFFEWRGADFADEIVIGASVDRKHDPDDEITSEELGAMLEACGQFDSAARDKALIALLRDTGLRIGAVLSLQLKHVDMEGNRATITINEDANVKDADGPKPVTWSRGYVANWLDVHPRANDPEAALIHKTRQVAPNEAGGAVSESESVIVRPGIPGTKKRPVGERASRPAARRESGHLDRPYAGSVCISTGRTPGTTPTARTPAGTTVPVSRRPGSVRRGRWRWSTTRFSGHRTMWPGGRPANTVMCPEPVPDGRLSRRPRRQ